MPMTAYARLMEMQADIEKIKAMSGSHRIAQDDERDLLPEEQSAVAETDEHDLIPGEKKRGEPLGLRQALN